MSLNASLLGALRCFEVAARHCNFTRAAAELNLTPGAVSQQIRQLEQRLGLALFRRLPRGLALTDEARDLLVVCGDAFGRLEQVLQRLGQPQAPLTVSCTPTFAMMWLMPRLQAFYAAHPHIQIRLQAEFHAIDAATMRAQGIDVAIRYQPPSGREGETILMDECLLPVGPPSLALASAARLHDASAWDGAATQLEWQTWLQGSGQTFTAAGGDQEFSLFMLACSAAQNGQGLAMGRLAMVLASLQSGALQAAAPVLVASPASYCLLAPDTHDARVQAWVDWLQQCCTEQRQQCDAYVQAHGLARV